MPTSPFTSENSMIPRDHQSAAWLYGPPVKTSGAVHTHTKKETTHKDQHQSENEKRRLKTCKLHHRCITSTTGSTGSNGSRAQVGLWCRCDAVSQHTEAKTATRDTRPWNAFYLRGNKTKISPMYWIVPQIVKARPPRLSRRESPKSERRTWPETKHTLR